MFEELRTEDLIRRHREILDSNPHVRVSYHWGIPTYDIRLNRKRAIGLTDHDLSENGSWRLRFTHNLDGPSYSVEQWNAGKRIWTRIEADEVSFVEYLERNFSEYPELREIDRIMCKRFAIR